MHSVVLHRNLTFTTWILLVHICVSAFGIYCPHYCKCHMNDNYRYVGCLNRGLVSIDLDVPVSVEWLELSGNAISSLEKNAFTKLKMIHIKILDLNKNTLSVIDHRAFEDLNYLEKVDLGNNHLYYLDPMTFEKNLRLITLDLSNNPLRLLPEPFLISKSIRMLNLQSCNLGYLPTDSFSDMPSLALLDLSYNQLIQMPQMVFEKLTNLRRIIIKGTHVSCKTSTDLMEMLKIEIYGDCPLINPVSDDVNDENTLQNTDSSHADTDSNLQEKFQKILMEPKESIKKEYDLTGIDNSSSTASPTVKIFTEVNVKNSYFYSISMILMIFFTGFFLGGILAYISVSLHKLYWRCKKRRRRVSSFEFIQVNPEDPRQLFSQSLLNQHNVSVSEPSAPPPSYESLFNPSRFS